jgi:hypothetical protein
MTWSAPWKAFELDYVNVKRPQVSRNRLSLLGPG